ncbi:MAG TPA: hypothetical protein DIU00_06210 [Phycisphaerales bacterium]|nr:hypothetical protein [Phycisphaerales bacterium]
MIRNILYLAIGSILLAGCVAVHETRRIPDDKRVTESQIQASGRLLRHVVLFKFKEDTTDEQVGQIERAFCVLPGKIQAIHDFEWGTDVSVENLQQGFTHCFVVTFRSRADRAKYLPHPAHKMFGQLLGPHLDKVLVIDYWTR